MNSRIQSSPGETSNEECQTDESKQQAQQHSSNVDDERKQQAARTPCVADTGRLPIIIFQSIKLIKHFNWIHIVLIEYMFTQFTSFIDHPSSHKNFNIYFNYNINYIFCCQSSNTMWSCRDYLKHCPCVTTWILYY